MEKGGGGKEACLSNGQTKLGKGGREKRGNKETGLFAYAAPRERTTKQGGRYHKKRQRLVVPCGSARLEDGEACKKIEREVGGRECTLARK